jgi:hypothetical protein
VSGAVPLLVQRDITRCSSASAPLV